MVDIKKIFNLMERIDESYQKHLLYKKELNEAMKDSFDFAELDRIVEKCVNNGDYSYGNAIVYCREQLGPEIGKGSSRYVFQISDEWCLKLAYNDKGIQQNKVEINTNTEKSPLFPFIYDSSLYNAWIVSEAVLTAEEQDFYHCLGMDMWEFFDLIDMMKSTKRYDTHVDEVNQAIDNDKSGFLKLLYDYIIKYDIPIGDLSVEENWGLTRRNGQDHIVLLDAGWNKETLEMYGFRASS